MAIDEECLSQARALVEQLEAGNEEEANLILETMTKHREQDLFTQLGKLTRELHDALDNFQLDSRLNSLASEELPDAKSRLNHVIEMTEEAANKTLTAVEECMPVSDDIQQTADNILKEWERFRKKDMNADEFRDLSKQIDEFLPKIHDQSAQLNSKLNEVLMAQGFQDLTGQIIRRVITLVQEVEESLVEIIRISGSHLLNEKPTEKAESDKKDTEAVGPAVPGVDDASNVVSGQDEVDDLLSSLGF